jgi:hypothetical protein
MKKLLSIILIGSSLLMANEQPTDQRSALAPHISVPSLHYGVGVGLGAGISSGALCALVDHTTRDSIWILTWLSAPTLRKLITQICFESFESDDNDHETLHRKISRRSQISKRAQVSEIIGLFSAWVSYYALREAFKRTTL